MVDPSSEATLESLLSAAMALSCGLVTNDGRLIACAHAPGAPDAHELASTALRLHGAAAPGEAPRECLVSWPAWKLLVRPVAAGLAFVAFDHRSSLALVRIRLADAFGPVLGVTAGT